eukprot:31118-Pelagococcus_subviridis.AAC.3
MAVFPRKLWCKSTSPAPPAASMRYANAYPTIAARPLIFSASGRWNRFTQTHHGTIEVSNKPSSSYTAGQSSRASGRSTRAIVGVEFKGVRSGVERRSAFTTPTRSYGDQCDIERAFAVDNLRVDDRVPVRLAVSELELGEVPRPVDPSRVGPHRVVGVGGARRRGGRRGGGARGGARVLAGSLFALERAAALERAGRARLRLGRDARHDGGPGRSKSRSEERRVGGGDEEVSGAVRRSSSSRETDVVNE